MNRYITHILKLKDTSGAIGEFSGLLSDGLSDKLDKILFQLPPSFHFNEENLRRVVENIPSLSSNVIEFRHISWWNEEVKAALAKKGCTFCNIDFPGLEVPFFHTSDRFYLRLHGVPELFRSPYTSVQLQKFALKIPSEAVVCNIYFNNTYYDAAYKNALEMMKILKVKAQGLKIAAT